MLNILDLPPDAPTSSDVLKLDVEGKLDLTVQSFIAQRTAILGSTGGGKTNTLALILEKVLPFMPTVIFDQHDEYWGLCEQYEILRVGKSELSQIKAGPEQAIQIAEISHSKRLSVLVEMLDMSRADRQDFVELYCSHIWELNKKSKLPYGIVLEEAQNFIPEGRTTPAQEMMKQFALEGRKFGFSIFISTQRSAEVSKTILAQCGLAFLHGVDIYPDVQAYAGMLPFTAAETKKIALNLSVGECIVKIKHDGPAKFLHPVKMLRRETFHVGVSPTLDDEAPPLRAIDAALLAELQNLLTKPVPEKKPDKELEIESNGEWKNIPALNGQIADLQHELDEAREEIIRLKAQIAVQPEAAKNGAILVVSPEKSVANVVADKNKPGVAAEWDGSSPLSTARAKAKQQRDFNSLVLTLGDMSVMHRRALVFLTQREGIAFQENDLIRGIGYARRTFQEHRPTRLTQMGLIQRKVTQNKYTYQSTVRTKLAEMCPDLEIDALVQQISRLEKV